MRSRWISAWLWGFAGLMLAGAAALAGWAVLGRFDAPPAARDAHRGAPAEPGGAQVSASADERALPALSAFRVVWKKQVRQPLFGPKHPEKAKAAVKPQKKKHKKPKKPPPPPLRVKLLATATEPAESYAVFKWRDRVAVRRVGETVDRAKVVRIQRKQVMLRDGERRVTLHVPRH